MLLHWCKSLFADELWVVIQPHEILLQRVSRRLNTNLKPEIVETKIIKFHHNLLEKNCDIKDCTILASYLRQALNEPMCQGATSKLLPSLKPRLVLANHLARYVVIPWNKELSAQEERLAYAKHSFAQTFGERAKDWEVRISHSVYGQSAIASAVDLKLLITMHAIFDELNMPLQTVSPQLMLIINHTFAELEKKKIIQKKQQEVGFWIVTIQHQRLCLALYDQCGWRLIKNMMAAPDVMNQIKTTMHREIVNGNLQQDLPILVYAPEFNNLNDLPAPFIQIPPAYFDVLNNLKSKHTQDLALV